MGATLLGKLTSPALTVGSAYNWTDTLTKDGATWDLSAQTVQLWFTRPNGSIFSKSASGDSSGNVSYTGDGTELNAIGPWRVAWLVVGFPAWLQSVPFNVTKAAG